MWLNMENVTLLREGINTTEVLNNQSTTAIFSTTTDATDIFLMFLKDNWIFIASIGGGILLIVFVIIIAISIRKCQSRKSLQISSDYGNSTLRNQRSKKSNSLNNNIDDVRSKRLQPDHVCYRRGTYGPRINNHPFLYTMNASRRSRDSSRCSGDEKILFGFENPSLKPYFRNSIFSVSSSHSTFNELASVNTFTTTSQTFAIKDI